MQDFNKIEKLIFTASIYARTKYQAETCKFQPNQKQLEFLQELMNSDIIKDAMIMLLSVQSGVKYDDVAKHVGDIRNRKLSDAQNGEIIDSILKTGKKIM